MAPWTLCTSGAAIYKAGLHANSTPLSGALLNGWSTETEGLICAECHTDFITNYSTYGASIQQALSEIASSMVAMKIIAWDPTGYLNREADMLMNLNDGLAEKGLRKLKEKLNQRLST